MSDADCTPGREPRSVAASLSVSFLHLFHGRIFGDKRLRVFTCWMPFYHASSSVKALHSTFAECTFFLSKLVSFTAQQM